MRPLESYRNKGQSKSTGPGRTPEVQWFSKGLQERSSCVDIFYKAATNFNNECSRTANQHEKQWPLTWWRKCLLGFFSNLKTHRDKNHEMSLYNWQKMEGLPTEKFSLTGKALAPKGGGVHYLGRIRNVTADVWHGNLIFPCGNNQDLSVVLFFSRFKES